jgi:hypothetical protein
MAKPTDASLQTKRSRKGCEPTDDPMVVPTGMDGLDSAGHEPPDDPMVVPTGMDILDAAACMLLE